jgi:hypothetical protein
MEYSLQPPLRPRRFDFILSRPWNVQTCALHRHTTELLQFARIDLVSERR